MELFYETLKADVELLASLNIMDYSLLVRLWTGRLCGGVVCAEECGMCGTRCCDPWSCSVSIVATMRQVGIHDKKKAAAAGAAGTPGQQRRASGVVLAQQQQQVRQVAEGHLHCLVVGRV